jgi:xanthine dehydrogenase YagS FAD-binding subunit
MRAFSYTRAADSAQALHLSKMRPHAKYLGGGTNLVDLMREAIETPHSLIDVTSVASEIKALGPGGLLIGASVSNTALAADARVREHFPMLSRAILSAASGQIRNMATVGGNIMQRTRCHYFYDGTAACNKRTPGDGCDARDGFNRLHAILGASSKCVATHSSDMCVALVALDAVVHIEGAAGKRTLKLADLHRLPGDTPEFETELAPGELIVAIELTPLPFARSSIYRKVRDRASYAFSIVSVAAALDVGADGAIRDVRLALGGVAPKPWRAVAAEATLRGKPATDINFHAAASAELEHATALRDNGFKIELAKRVIVSALHELSAGPRS